MFLVLLTAACCAHLGLGGKVGHERSCGVTSVVLLNEGDGGVDNQKHDDTDEVLPVRRLATSVGQGNGHDGSHLHDPGQGVPHEPEELENLALLHHAREPKSLSITDYTYKDPVQSSPNKNVLMQI